MTIMVMPMAGAGSRTSTISSMPKPLILIDGFPMFYWAAKNIKADKKIFVVRNDHVKDYQIDSLILKLFPESTIVVQDKKLDGQMISILEAKKYLNTDEDLFLIDCDMYSEINFDKILDLDSNISIVTFLSNLPNYSYVSKKDDVVVSITEKHTITGEAVGGIFYWKSSNDFLKYANNAINKNIKTNNEFYVSSAISEALLDSKVAKTIISEKTYDLSTENGISLFLENIKND